LSTSKDDVGGKEGEIIEGELTNVQRTPSQKGGSGREKGKVSEVDEKPAGGDTEVQLSFLGAGSARKQEQREEKVLRAPMRLAGGKKLTARVNRCEALRDVQVAGGGALTCRVCTRKIGKLPP